MRHRMREKVQSKLNSMASILLDDILVPDQIEQQGSETLVGSYYDEDGNKFTFTLSLTVAPKKKAETEETEEPVNISDQIATILEKIIALEEDVSVLKNYHLTAQEPTETTEQNNPTENPQEEGSGQNDEGLSP